MFNKWYHYSFIPIINKGMTYLVSLKWDWDCLVEFKLIRPLRKFILCQVWKRLVGDMDDDLVYEEDLWS